MSALPPDRGATSYGRQGDYVFIDNVRFFSMIAILMRHCELSLFGSESTSPLESAIVQFRTFGVQLFFVNSAFLMAEWLARRDSNVRGYWQSRWHQVAIPWLVWMPIYTVIELLKALARHEEVVTILPREVVKAAFFQSYWFVPVLFFSLAVLLPMRRWWQSWWLGLGSLVLSLTYGVNQYTAWFPPSHTIAFVGYLFPLWVGLQLFRHFRRVSAWIERVPWSLAGGAFCLAFGLTIAEDQIMTHLGFPDAYNALQVSNQLYAFVALVVLLKLPGRLVPSFIDVRKESYGIYLSHQIVASLGVGAFHLMSGMSVVHATAGYGPVARITLWFLWSAVVYLGCLLTTKMLRSTSCAWTVGVRDGSGVRDASAGASPTPSSSIFNTPPSRR